MQSLWNEIAAAANRELREEQHAQLERYLELLLQANQRMNLTRITEPDKARLQHVADALTALKFFPENAHAIVDLGSGGGVPGIPLAIACPDKRFVLIESTQKKAAFLRATSASLGLNNVEVLGDRAEDVARTGRRASFDVVTSRAVALLPWLVEWSLPLLRIDGVLLAMKGPRVEEEMPAAKAACKLIGASEPVIHQAGLPGLEDHLIVVAKKTRPTIAQWPRAATLAKEPIQARG